MTETLQISPLIEADPNSLDELFSRIDAKLVLGLPREISNFDIDKVVEYYIRERVRFIHDQENNIKPARAAKGKVSGSFNIEI